MNKINNFLIERIFNFDLLLSLRGLACISVIFFHSFVSIDIIKTNYFFWFPFLLDGSGAVLIFFILSGYLMTKLFVIKKYDWTKNGLKKYYLARFNRIFPLYWFVCIFGAVFIGTTFLRPRGLLDLAKFFTFTQYFWDSKDIAMANYNWLSIAWSLVVEVQFYLLVPIISFVLIKFKSKIFYTFISLIILLLLYKNNLIEFGTQVFGYKFGRNVIPYLPFFVSGGLVAILLQFEKIRALIQKFTFSLPLLLITLFFVPAFNKAFSIVGFNDFTNLFYIIVTGLIIALFESFNFNKKPSGWNYNIQDLLNPKKIFEILGHLSFSAYLWHLSIIYSVGGAWVYSDYKNYISEPTFILLRFFFTLFLIILISLITFKTVEKVKLFESKNN